MKLLKTKSIGLLSVMSLTSLANQSLRPNVNSPDQLTPGGASPISLPTLLCRNFCSCKLFLIQSVADPEGGQGAMAPPKPLAIFLILRISH